MTDSIIRPYREAYQEYLTDESQLTGHAQSISFPADEQELQETVRELAEAGIPATIQGGRTGISGGAVPMGGHILNLSKMNRIKGFEQTGEKSGLLTVEPGLTLLELRNEIRKLPGSVPLFWPPDPTEESATIGGIAACASRGCTAYRYGATGKHIESMRITGSDGAVTSVDHNDGLDFFIGSEGIFGVITEITLRLSARPEEQWGIAFFFLQKAESLRFAAMVRELKSCISAVEYIDRRCIDIVEANKSFMTNISGLPDVKKDAQAMIYVQIEGREEQVEETAEQLLAFGMECGSDPDEAWALSGEKEIEKLQALRHAVPESINLLVKQAHQRYPEIVKLGTDMMEQDQDPAAMLAEYEEDMREHQLDGCTFGHVGEGHLHVNLLPKDPEEFRRGRELLHSWAERSCSRGGTAVSEHGVGKLKREMFAACMPEELRNMRKYKHKHDPSGLWNPGDVFE